MHTLLLVAQAANDRHSILNAMRQGLQEPQRGTDMTIVVVGALVVITLAAVLVLIPRLRQSHTPKTDYLSEMGRHIGLTPLELRDLHRLTDAARLAQPAAVLLSPANLARAVERATAAQRDPALRNRAERLAQKLFGTGLPAPGSSPQ